MKLCAIHSITGEICLRSGLHIGAGKDTVEIGGLDQPIVKNPLNGAPYIPGSSLKGKMRSLLETAIFMGKSDATRKAVTSGKPCDCGLPSCPVCTLFGAHKPPKECDPQLGPTRLLLRDACLTPEYDALFRNGRLPMEIKNENIINRLKGVAEHPRPLERVPAGVRFELNMALKIYERDDARELADWVFKGLRLVEMDALGGCSSRGCGQVSFEGLTRNGNPVDLSAITVFAPEVCR